MKIILITALLAFAQTAHADWSAYYPDGKKIAIKWRTIANLLDSLGVKESSSYSGSNYAVYFKRLSNKPVFVLFLDKAQPEKIRDLIASYNTEYQEYLFSYSYFADINSMIKSKTLTRRYLQEVFGKPDVDWDNRLVFKNYNAEFLLNDTLVHHGNVVNYRAYKKTQLLIGSWDVLEDDYYIGFKIDLTNLSTKTIKYIYITATAYNSVRDKIGTKTVRAIGPITQDQEGEYSFSELILTRVGHSLSLDQMKIEYMDGAIKVLSKKDIQSIVTVDWVEEGQRTLAD